MDKTMLSCSIQHTGKDTQHSAINHNGKEKERVDILNTNDGRSPTVPADRGWSDVYVFLVVVKRSEMGVKTRPCRGAPDQC